MVHICANRTVLHGHASCMVDWLKTAIRCDFCGMRFDTEKVDKALKDAKSAAEKERKRKAEDDEEDKEDDTLWGMPSKKETRAKRQKVDTYMQPKWAVETVVLPDNIQKKTLEDVKMKMREVATADLEKGDLNPLQYFRGDGGQGDRYY